MQEIETYLNSFESNESLEPGMDWDNGLKLKLVQASKKERNLYRGLSLSLILLLVLNTWMLFNGKMNFQRKESATKLLPVAQQLLIQTHSSNY